MKKDKTNLVSFPQTVIWRHIKENLKKCSLRGLEQRPDMCFVEYPTGQLPPMEGYILLSLDAPVLTESDDKYGLFLIDGTWRYAAAMEQALKQQFPKLYASMMRRCLPDHMRTAYPRYQTLCPQPDQGLASVEALYAAYRLMGRDTAGLLDGYYWSQEFLLKNGWNGNCFFTST